MSDPASPLVLIASCLSMGLTVGLCAYLVGAKLEARGLAAELARSGAPAVRARRRPSGLAALATPLLPFFTAFGRTLRLTSLRTTLGERYARAGYPGGFDDDQLVGLALLAGAALCAPAIAILAAVDPRLAPLGALVFITGPGLVSAGYGSSGARRELAISRAMPFVLDLLVLTMRAGASLQQALERVAADYVDHPIGMEISAVLTDLGTGMTTKEAFEKLQERVRIAPVKSFVEDLVQGEELGRPLADIFERQADHARTRRVQEATDTAGRARVLVLIPGMLVFIAVLVILFAPFFLRWYYGGWSLG